MENNVKKNDTRCGAGACHPKVLQKFANMKVFIINMSIIQLFIIVFFTITTGSLRTIEKRFGLRSAETGFLNSVGDIVQTVVVVFIGYLGGKIHKLRLLSCMLFLAGFGTFMMAIPYLIFGPKDLSTTTVRKQGNTSVFFQNSLGLCVPGDELTDQLCEDQNAKKTNDVAYSVFVAANAVIGFGASAVMSLSISYIDENVPRGDSALYIGILTSMFPIGPIVGFSLAAVLLKLPENLRDSLVTPDNPNFIGAWWLGYVIAGCVIITTSLPLFFFPKHMPHYYVKRKTAIEKKKLDSTQSGPRSRPTKTIALVKFVIKDFLGSLWRILSNPAYLTVSASYVCIVYVVIGLYSNVPRYMEIHFRQSAFMANIITATSSAVAAAIGNLVGGILLKKLKITPLGSAKIFVGTILISTTGTFLKMWIACDPIEMAGIQSQDSGSLDINLPCMGNCSCSQKFIQPVCASGKLNYFSPCHAGCTGYNETQKLYLGCSCPGEGTPVTTGTCEGSCSLVIAYIVVTFISSFMASVGRVPVMVLALRVIDDDLKPFAIAVQSFTMNLLAFIPGPIFFGAMIDATCRVWQDSCGQPGVCLLYDTDRFRYIIHGVTSVFQFVGFLFAIATLYLVRRDTLRGRWDENPRETNEPSSEKEKSKDNQITITKL